MVQYLSGSAWSVTVRRIMENIMITLPVCAILFIPVALGLKHIYSWTDVHMMQASPALKGKVGYLSQHVLRSCAPTSISRFGASGLFAIYRNSTKQDRERSVKQMHNNSRWSAPGLVSYRGGGYAGGVGLGDVGSAGVVFDDFRFVLSGRRSARRSWRW